MMSGRSLVAGAAPGEAAFAILLVLYAAWLRRAHADCHERRLRAPFLALLAAATARALDRWYARRAKRRPPWVAGVKASAERCLGGACGTTTPLGLMLSVPFWSGFLGAAVARLRRAFRRRAARSRILDAAARVLRLR